jgi:biotin carboxyl carrier protein
MNITLHIDGKPVTLENVARGAQEISFTLAGVSYQFHGERLPGGDFIVERETTKGLQRLSGAAWPIKDSRRVQLGAWEASIAERPGIAAQAGEMPLSPNAPMPGIIRQILVKTGDKVKRDQPLIVMEAMKLQTTLSAGGNGVVKAVLVKVGEMVAEGAELVKIK